METQEALSDVKVGDLLARTVYKSGPGWEIEKYIPAKVTKVGPKTFWVGGARYYNDGRPYTSCGGGGRLVLVSDEIRAGWKAAREAEAAAEQARKERRESEAFRLADTIIGSGEVERLEALGVDKLRRIVAIIEEGANQ